MKLGPKFSITAEPLDLSGLPGKGPTRVAAFCSTYLQVPKGVGARQPFRLRKWQREIVGGLYPTFGPRPRQGLISIPRGNGKTSLAAVLALYNLFADNVEGAQVLCVASEERQARIAWNAARRMVELSPELAARCQIFQDRLLVPHTDSECRPLPGDPRSLQGWDPTFAVVDELSEVPRDVWDSMALASGKRERSLVLAISTPADDRDSCMWSLVEHGRRGDDPSFYLREYAAPHGCDSGDEAAWAIANPALGDFLALDALRSTHRTTREAPFRQRRLGQWVGHVDAWMPWGLWQTLATDRAVAPRSRITAAFDGSASGDSTALIGCTLDDPPHLFVLGCWEHDSDPRWRVPRAEVDRAVDLMFDTYDVAELACDPWGWRSEIEAWAARHGERRVIEFPSNIISRMAPATDRFYAACVEGNLSHDGDPRLARHVGNCVATSTAQGDIVTKDRRSSPRKIDAAVCSIIAVDRAIHHARKRRRAVAW